MNKLWQLRKQSIYLSPEFSLHVSYSCFRLSQLSRRKHIVHKNIKFRILYRSCAFTNYSFTTLHSSEIYLHVYVVGWLIICYTFIFSLSVYLYLSSYPSLYFSRLIYISVFSLCIFISVSSLISIFLPPYLYLCISLCIFISVSSLISIFLPPYLYLSIFLYVSLSLSLPLYIALSLYVSPYLYMFVSIYLNIYISFSIILYKRTL